MARRAIPIRFLPLVLAVFAGSCAPAPRAVVTERPPDPRLAAERALRGVVDAHVARLAPLVRELNLAWWGQATGTAPEAKVDLAALEMRIRALYGDPQQRAFVLGQAAAPPRDASLARELQLLSAQFRANTAPADQLRAQVQKQEALMRQLAAFRPRLDGEDLSPVQVLDRLAASRDGKRRRAAYAALLAIGPRLRPGLLDLVRQERRLAGTGAQADPLRQRLLRDELDPDWFDSLCQALERGTDRALARYQKRLARRLSLRFSLPADAPLTPAWLDDPFLRRPPGWTQLDRAPLFDGREPKDALAGYLRALGLSPDAVLKRSRFDTIRSGPALVTALDVDREGDVRLLARLPAGSRYAGELFFEMGRAVFLAHLDPALPWLLRQPAHPLIIEGVARFLAQRLWQPTWLIRHLSVDARRLRSTRARLRREFQDAVLLRTRYLLMVIRFERALLADPDQDLDALWAKLRLSYQGVVVSREQAAAEWPTLAQLFVDPLAAPEQLLGLVLAAQLEHHRVEADLQAPADLGRFLSGKLIRPGARLRWDALLREALGEGLKPDDLLALFEAEPGRP